MYTKASNPERGSKQEILNPRATILSIFRYYVYNMIALLCGNQGKIQLQEVTRGKSHHHDGIETRIYSSVFQI